MKILYGIQGTGNGHLTRARLIAAEFNKHKDVQVTYLFSGRDEKDYFDMDVFKGNVIFKKGLTFSIKDGKVDIWKTIKNNDITQFLKDIDNIQVQNYDLVISDYEPIVSWACKCYNKECIGIGHQYAFNYNVPKVAGKLVHLGMKWFAPSNIAIGLHWDSFNSPILPPIIDSLKPLKEKDFYVVYLPNENLQDIINQLSIFSEETFHIFSKISLDTLPKNIKIKPIAKDSFLNDLRQCKGVICNAGFELASETISLGKKLLVKPVHNQIEQLANAKAIKKLNYGMAVDEINWVDLKIFLNEYVPENLPKYPNVAVSVVNWILKRPYSLEKLSSLVWYGVKYGK